MVTAKTLSALHPTYSMCNTETEVPVSVALQEEQLNLALLFDWVHLYVLMN